VEDIKIKKSSYICSDHFEQACFFSRESCVGSQNPRRLKKGAVPTIFKIKVNCYKLILQYAVTIYHISIPAGREHGPLCLSNTTKQCLTTQQQCGGNEEKFVKS
jgi:hypothetical protein